MLRKHTLHFLKPRDADKAHGTLCGRWAGRMRTGRGGRTPTENREAFLNDESRCSRCEVVLKEMIENEMDAQ